jgi:hypothetical protein
MSRSRTTFAAPVWYGRPTPVTAAVFESFQALAASWPKRERFSCTDGGSVQVCWVPGHAQIPENEAADQAAKRGAAMDPPSLIKHSYASLKRQARADAMSALLPCFTACRSLPPDDRFRTLQPPYK